MVNSFYCFLFTKYKGVKMRSFLFSLMIILLTSCVTVIKAPDEIDPNEMHNAIADNDSTKVRNILKNKSFIKKEMPIFDSGSTRYARMVAKNNAYFILDEAITGKSHGSYPDITKGLCRTEIVQSLLDAGLPPRSDDLAKAATTPCTGIINLLITKLTTDEIDKASQMYLEQLKKELPNQNIYEFSKYDYNRINLTKPGLDLLTNKNQSICQSTNTNCEISNKLSEMNIKINSQLLTLEKIKETQNAARKKIESKYKMSFCKFENLFFTIFASTNQIEKNCIYSLTNPLKILQSQKTGILASLTEPTPGLMDKVIFIQTDKPYADAQLIRNILVQSTGLIKYKTILGTEKTVDSFKLLGDINSRE